MRAWIKDLFRRGRPRRQPSLHKSRPAVEELEARRLPSFAAATDEFLVNQTTAGDQQTGFPARSVAALPDGRSVVSWQSSDVSGDPVYARVFNADGSPLTDELLVNQYTTNQQGHASVAADADGDFVVSWQSNGQDGSGYGVYARRYSAAGLAQGDEFQVNQYTTGNQQYASVAMDADGDFVVSWESDGQDGSGFGVYARRYSASGLAQADEFQVNQHTTSQQRYSSVAMDADGDFVVSWQSFGQDGSGYGVYARRYSASGLALANEFLVNQHTTNSQSFSSVAMDADGDFVVSWSSYGQDGDLYGVYARRYSASGLALTDEFQVNQYTTSYQRYASVAMDADGDFVVSWSSYGQDGDGWGVYARRYSAAGLALDVEFQVNQHTTNHQLYSSVAMDADGDFVVSWESFDQDGDGYGVYARRYVDADDNGDTAGPMVAGVFASANLNNDQHITDGERLAADVPLLDVTFSEQLLAGTVTDPANWRLTRNGVDISAQITSIGYAYDAGQNKRVATLSLAAPLSDGNYVLTVRSGITDLAGNRLDGDFDGSGFGEDYRLRFTIARAVAAGDEFLVNQTTAGNQQTGFHARAVAARPDGGFVVTWESPDGDGFGVYARVFNADGSPLTDELLVNQYTTNQQQNASVALDADGDFVVCWQSLQDGDSWGAYARRYSASGLALADEFQVNQYTTSNQRNASVAMDADGDFVVSWSSFGQDGDGWGVYARRYSASGLALADEFQVNQVTTNNQRYASVAMDADGDFVVSWQSYGQDGEGYGVYARRYSASGLALADEFQVNQHATREQRFSSVAMDADGDFVVCWQSLGQDGDSYGVYARRYSASGLALTDEFQVNQYTTENQQYASVAMDADGDFVVSWESYGQDGDYYGVYARRYSAAGIALADEFQVNQHTTNHQLYSSVAMDADGDFVVSWESYGQDGDRYGVYARRYQRTAVVESVRVAGDPSPIDPGERLVAAIPAGPSLIVQFSRAMQQASVEDTANWVLTKDGSDISAQITAVSYNALSLEATLTLSSLLADGDYVLTARGTATILDGDGRALDGDFDGSPGGDHVLAFTILVPAGGNEFRVNQTTAGYQRTGYRSRAVAAGPDGRYVVTWAGPDGSGDGVYARVYGADGAPLTGEFRVNQYTNNHQRTASVAVDADGDFVVAWQSYGQDGDRYGIYARRYSAAGAALGGEFQVNQYTTFAQRTASVAMDADGDFVVSWESYFQDGEGYGVYARRYSAAGAALAGEFQVNQYTTRHQVYSSVAMDADGDFVLSWQSYGQDGIFFGVYARRYSASGLAKDDEFLVNQHTTGDQGNASVAVDAEGDFVVSWSSYGQDGDRYGIYARRYSASGLAQGDEFQVNQHTTRGQLNASVAMDADGDFVVSWESYLQDGERFGIYARRYSASGAALGGEFQVNQYTTSYQQNASVAVDADGDFVVSWESYLQDGSGYGVYARRYTPSVEILGTDGADTIVLDVVDATHVNVTINGTDLGAFPTSGAHPMIVRSLGGADTVTVNGSGAPLQVEGGADTDTLVGGNVTNSWILNGSNAGTLNGIPFTSMENLKGGIAVDNFIFRSGGGVSGALDGNGGGDTLNYSLYGSGVSVNLSLGTATGVTGGISGIRNLTGSSFDDALTGDAQNNVIDARGGTDTLAGGDGNDKFYLHSSQNAATTVDGGNDTDTLVGANSTNTWTITGAASGNVNGIAFSNLERVTGGSGTDTLVAPNSANAWSLGSSNGGTLNSITYAGMENLKGGTAVDNFVFSGSGGVTGTLNGNGGGDTLNYSLYGSGVSANLSTGTATGVAGGVSGVRNVTGSAFNDTLTGDGQNNVLDARGGTDALAGGDANDTFYLHSSQNAATTVAGGDGTDTVVGANITNTWTISGAAAGDVNGIAFSATEKVMGGTGTDTLVGPNSTNAWSLTGSNSGTLNSFTYAGMENLKGGTAVDNFIFKGGSVSGTLNGNGGGDTLNYSLYGSGVSVNLTLGTATAVAGGVSNVQHITGSAFNDTLTGDGQINTIDARGGTDTLAGGDANDKFYLHSSQNAATTIDGGLGTDTVFGANIANTWTITGATAGDVNGIAFSNMDKITGGSGTDTLAGPNSANAWTVNGSNQGVLNTLTFAGMENLKGGTAVDSFIFGSSGAVTGTLDGNGGGDTLNYATYGSGVSVNLSTGTATGVTGGISNIQNVTGSAFNDTLTGDGQANTIDARGGTDTLAGGDNNDKFYLGSTQGASTTVDGGNGTDTVFGAGITNAWTITGAAAGNVNGIAFSATEKVTGGSGTDTLAGPNSTNAWVINASNGGVLNSLTYTGMENLKGGTAVDNFRFANGAGITGTLDGNGGGDFLDYSIAPSGVTVNLTTGSATGVAGGVSNVQNVLGSAFADTLTGNADGNVLLGNAGADSITAGTGRSVLIGGVGGDTLTGGSLADDVVIAGRTGYDPYTAAHEAALLSILAEWQSADSYALRRDHLRGTAGGLNSGNFLLANTNVFDDAVTDTLTGGIGLASLDWFFARQTGTAAVQDTLTDLDALNGEQVDPIG